MRRMTERAAKRLPGEPDVLELDVNDDEHLADLARELSGRWGGVDGVVHAIAFAPGDALGGNFVGAPRESACAAFETSAYSLKALAAALAPLMIEATERSAKERNRRPRLRRRRRMAVLRLDGRREGRARVGRPLPGARPRPRGIRVNLVAAGPVATPAASGIPGFGDLAQTWAASAPLGWDAATPAPSRTPRSSS